MVLCQIALMKSFLRMLVVGCALALAASSGMLQHALDAPYSVHEWRQRDALSQTLRYLEPNRGFFEPAIHFQHAVDGRGAGEFTGLYYLNALLWKALGEPVPWTLRWTQGAFLVLGLSALARAVTLWSGKGGVGGAAALAVFASPLIQFYGVNYLVNTSALMAVFMAWWFAARSEQPGRNAGRELVGASLLLAFAGLLRPTMLIGGLPMLVRWWRTQPTSWAWAGACGGGVLVTVASWVIWAKSYNAAHDSTYFLTTVRPVWSTADVKAVWTELVTVRLQDVFDSNVRWLLLGLAVLTLARARREWGRFQHGLVLTVLAVLAYGVLWFSNLDVHDYYLLEALMVVPLIVLWMADVWSGERWKWWRVGVFVLAFVYQGAHSVARNQMKWGRADGILVERLVAEEERAEWKWFHWDQRERWSALSELPEHLAAWGVPDSALVLSVPDGSPNVSLTRVQRMGFTSLYESDLHAGDRVEWAVGRGAAYLIVNQPALLEKGDWGAWLDHPVGVHRNVAVFDLRAVVEGEGDKLSADGD